MLSREPQALRFFALLPDQSRRFAWHFASGQPSEDGERTDVWSCLAFWIREVQPVDLPKLVAQLFAPLFRFFCVFAELAMGGGIQLLLPPLALGPAQAHRGIARLFTAISEHAVLG
jgi:hypothetical protein